MFFLIKFFVLKEEMLTTGTSDEIQVGEGARSALQSQSAQVK